MGERVDKTAKIARFISSRDNSHVLTSNFIQKSKWPSRLRNSNFSLKCFLYFSTVVHCIERS